MELRDKRLHFLCLGDCVAKAEEFARERRCNFGSRSFPYPRDRELQHLNFIHDFGYNGDDWHEYGGEPMKKQVCLFSGMIAIALLAACTGVIPDAPPTASTPADVGQLPAPAAAPEPAQRLIDRYEGASETNGDVLFLFGQVLDTRGDAVPNALVEIWQTDAGGVYDHPGDPGTADRDRSFQFFGSTPVDAAGWYAFRTIVPGRYEPRPRHIHYKVKQEGETLLTSQFYFSDDVADVEGEAMFRVAWRRWRRSVDAPTRPGANRPAGKRADRCGYGYW